MSDLEQRDQVLDEQMSQPKPVYQTSITFGSKHQGYARWPKADPKGWLVIQSDDPDLLTDKVVEMFYAEHPGGSGRGFLEFAFQYAGGEPSSSHLYWRGVLETISVWSDDHA